MNPWYDTVRRLRNRWQRQRFLRAVVTLALLAFAVFVEYLLMTNIRLAQPVDVGHDSKYAQAVAEAKNQEIIISNLRVNPRDGILFSHQGRTNETMTFSSTMAKLSPEGLDLLKDLAEETHNSPPPEGFEKIDYRIADNAPESIFRQSKNRTDAQGATTLSSKPYETCTVSMVLRLINGKIPKEIRFLQPETGTQTLHSIKITVIDADVSCKLLVAQPKSGARSPGCGKSIQIRDWKLPSVQGELAQLEIVLAANSTSSFSFHTINSAVEGAAQLTDSDGRFEPLKLGDQSLQAETIRVMQATPSNSPTPKPAREVIASGSKNLLTVRSIKSGMNDLLLDFSGVKAYVKSNDEDIDSVSLLGRLLQYPMIATFLGFLHLAIFGWANRSVFKSAAE